MKNIQAITLEIDGEEVTIQNIDNKLHISIPKKLHTIIEHRDAGEPGIIGPHILHDILALSKEAVKQQKQLFKMK